MKLMIKFWFLFILVVGCVSNYDGFVSVCSNIKEAKQRGVFLAEYEVTDYSIANQFGFDGGEEIWLERIWRKDSKNIKGVSFENTGTQKHLNINFVTTDSMERYGKDWFLGNSYELNFRSANKSSLICNVSGNVPNKLIIPIMSKRVLNGLDNYKIGEIVLAKVN